MDNRHSWINYPNRSNRKCIKCGCMKHLKGKNGILYIKDGQEFINKSPECNMTVFPGNISLK